MPGCCTWGLNVLLVCVWVFILQSKNCRWRIRSKLWTDCWYECKCKCLSLDTYVHKGAPSLQPPSGPCPSIWVTVFCRICLEIILNFPPKNCVFTDLMTKVILEESDVSVQERSPLWLSDFVSTLITFPLHWHLELSNLICHTAKTTRLSAVSFWELFVWTALSRQVTTPCLTVFRLFLCLSLFLVCLRAWIQGVVLQDGRV